MCVYHRNPCDLNFTIPSLFGILLLTRISQCFARNEYGIWWDELCSWAEIVFLNHILQIERSPYAILTSNITLDDMRMTKPTPSDHPKPGPTIFDEVILLADSCFLVRLDFNCLIPDHCSLVRLHLGHPVPKTWKGFNSSTSPKVVSFSGFHSLYVSVPTEPLRFEFHYTVAFWNFSVNS